MAAGLGRRLLSGPAVRQQDRALVPTLVVVAALVSIVGSLGAPLIPTIARTDGVSLSTAQWLLTAALLSGALATPVMGRLADGPKQREVVLVALSSVFVGCVLAATANEFVLVVVGRGLQGVGFGLLPVTMAIARSRLPTERASHAIATLSITAAIGVGLGYPLTSLIAQLLDIHAAFWFGATAVAGALALTTAVLPRGSQAPSRHFDVVGALALSAAVVGLSVVLSEGTQWGWATPRSVGLLVLSALVLGLWVWYELRHDDPLIDLRQVRHRSVLTADVSGFLLCVALYLLLPSVVEFVQIPTSNGYGFGLSILVAGLALVPLSIATFVASRGLAAVRRRFGTRGMIPLGSLIFAVATLFFAIEHGTLWEAFVTLGIAGLGYGLSFAAMPGFIVRAVPASETGSATGFYQVLRSIGLSVGSALGAALLAAYTHGHDTYPSVGGFRVVLLTASALCAITTVISYVMPGKDFDRAATRLSDRAEGIVESESEFDGTSVAIGE